MENSNGLANSPAVNALRVASVSAKGPTLSLIRTLSSPKAANVSARLMTTSPSARNARPGEYARNDWGAPHLCIEEPSMCFSC